MALMKKRSALRFMMMVALLATSFLQLHARVHFPEQEIVYGGGSESGGKACCDMCVCTRSIPPQCRCWDVKPYCHPSCKSCLCNWSYPPKCECFDVKDHCDKECTTPRL